MAKHCIDSKTESSAAEEPEGQSGYKKSSQPLNEQIQDTIKYLNASGFVLAALRVMGIKYLT
jgi:hypothetical protein